MFRDRHTFDMQRSWEGVREGYRGTILEADVGAVYREVLIVLFDRLGAGDVEGGYETGGEKCGEGLLEDVDGTALGVRSTVRRAVGAKGRRMIEGAAVASEILESEGSGKGYTPVRISHSWSESWPGPSGRGPGCWGGRESAEVRMGGGGGGEGRVGWRRAALSMESGRGQGIRRRVRRRLGERTRRGCSLQLDMVARGAGRGVTSEVAG